MPMLACGRTALSVCFTVTTTIAHATPFFFSTDSPDGRMGMGAIPGTQTADDFVVSYQTVISSAAFYGLIPLGEQVSTVRVDVFRTFPLDSVNPPSGHVPTRVNSPSDVEFPNTKRMSGVNMNFTSTTLSPSFAAANSVLVGINPVPNSFTGGEGAVNGAEVLVVATFNPPITLPAGHYFIALQVHPTSGAFYWLSAAKPIAVPGTPFSPDLQAWITNANIAPDWLRIGTDIVGGGTPPTFNAAFTLSGTDEVIFRNGFDPS